MLLTTANYSCNKISSTRIRIFRPKLKWLFLNYYPSDHDVTSSNSCRSKTKPYKRKKKLARQTYQTLSNDEEVCIPSLFNGQIKPKPDWSDIPRFSQIMNERICFSYHEKQKSKKAKTRGAVLIEGLTRN